MLGTQNGTPAYPLEVRWHSAFRPLPTRWVVPDGRRPRPAPRHPNRTAPFDFCDRMRAVCDDIVSRCEALRHVRVPSLLLSFTPSRNRSRYGLQARVTPLRFLGGELVHPHGAVDYQVQRFFVDDVEMLYVVTFCLPRFLDQTFEEKLVTVFHELYHISPAFDGDLRRLPGRCAIHSHSKDGYDAHMAELVRDYLEDHPDPELFAFLKLGYAQLWDRHGGITGVVVPRPKLLPVGRAAARAARNRLQKPGIRGQESPSN